MYWVLLRFKQNFIPPCRTSHNSELALLYMYWRPGVTENSVRAANSSAAMPINGNFYEIISRSMLRARPVS